MAPGFKLGNVIVMAGVPDVMQVMLDAVTPRLTTGKKMLSVTIELLRPEGEVAELFGQQAEFPDVPMGSYPFNREAASARNSFCARRIFSVSRLLRQSFEHKLRSQGLS